MAQEIDKQDLIKKAFNFHLHGNIKEAIKYYEYFINKGFEDHRVFSNYGVILKDLGKLKEAELSTRKAIELNPKFENAHYNLGNILKDLGKLKEAELSTRKAILINPNFVEAHFNLGNILKDLGKLKEAELSTRKAIELNPKFANAYSNLGIILKDLGNLKEAELSTRKATELNPNFAEAHSNLGCILSDLGKLKEAELSLRKAIKLKPYYVMAHSNLGKILNDLGKLKEAELSTRKAIELNPKFADAHYNMGKILRELDKLKEAELSTRKAIKLNPNFVEAHSNLGCILSDLGKLKEAELSTRKAIELNPFFAKSYLNLGNILINIGKLTEAEFSYRKALEIDPCLAKAYFSLSQMQNSDNLKILQDNLFSKNILDTKSQKEKIYIYFARANFLHKKREYEESYRYLKLANNLKFNIKPTKPENLFSKSKALLIESLKKEINKNIYKISYQNIFIVGMPRCGSTLVESILTLNKDVGDLGEINILEESFLDYKNSEQDMKLADLYFKKINAKTKLHITTNKWLYNYQYAGIIARDLPNAKIIHCFRNPLDNILSIYRANFASGNEYSSSLIDCAKVYLNQEEVMSEYKNRFRTCIYDLNYESLVSNPNEEIKSLISWLGWKWEDKYLSPHLNVRSVTTASNVQVRSPINTKSVGGWKNYKEMLRPAMEIITQNNKYKDLKY